MKEWVSVIDINVEKSLYYTGQQFKFKPSEKILMDLNFGLRYLINTYHIDSQLKAEINYSLTVCWLGCFRVVQFFL